MTDKEYLERELLFERVNEHQLNVKMIEVKQFKYKAQEDIHMILSKLIDDTGCKISSVSCNHDRVNTVGNIIIDTLDVDIDLEI